MRVLVTGSAGFIGSHLVRELREYGHEVTGAGFDAELEGDLLEHPFLYHAFTQAQPQVVVHCAAVVGRELGELNAQRTTDSNVFLTAEVAKACAIFGSRLVYPSTSEVYGDHQGEWVHEWSPRRPLNLYGWSKLWGEQIASHYCPDVSIARLVMPYGPGHPPGEGRCALTNFLWQALRSQPIVVHAGSARSWCWVGDTVRALRLLAEREAPLLVNVGRDDDLRAMLDVALLALGLASVEPVALVVEQPLPAGLTAVKRLSCARLRHELDWQPEVTLEDGMQRTLDWLRAGLSAVGEPAIAQSVAIEE